MSSIPVSIADIRSKDICQDPTNWISEGWSGTLMDLYNLGNLEDFNKVLMGCFFLSEEELSAFIEWMSLAADVDEFVNVLPKFVAAWKCSKKANATGQIPLAAQVIYLKGIEIARI